jgi:hypothetical protein
MTNSAGHLKWPIKTENTAINGSKYYLFLGMEVDYREADDSYSYSTDSRMDKASRLVDHQSQPRSL